MAAPVCLLASLEHLKPEAAGDPAKKIADLGPLVAYRTAPDSSLSKAQQ